MTTASQQPAVDAVTLQLVSNSLASIADEMATTLFRTAHSTVVRDGMDFSAAITTAAGETVAQAVTVPFHLGSVPDAMETLLQRFAGGFREGDIYMLNDPFDGGIHLPDIFIAKPVFFEGDLVAFAVTSAHHGDVGGRVPGSSASDNTEIFQEGIRLPWVRLHDSGHRVEDIYRILAANVRVPHTTLGDISAQVAACVVAERGIQDLYRNYGANEMPGILAGLIDYTERLVRSEIETWADGEATFTDYLDTDGIDVIPVPLTCKLTISGSQVTADFSDSADMVRGSLNSTRSFIKAAVYHAVRCALTSDIPNTAGMYAAIDIITRPGSIAHVVMPGASSMRGVTGFRAFDAASGALAQILPDRVPAASEGGNSLVILSGKDNGGSRYVFYELVCGTWGGSPGGDGNDGISNPASTAANMPVESVEAKFPLVIERYGLVPDSGGPGKHRGGLALERVWRPLTDDVLINIRSDRQVHPPYGLSGGEAGSPSRNLIARRGGDLESHPPMFRGVLNAGDVYTHRIAGGGGWGIPWKRDPADVLDDVVDEKISLGAAYADYGVALRPDLTIDAEATAARRAELATTSAQAGGD